MTVARVGSVGAGNVTNGAGPLTISLPQAATAGNSLILCVTGSSGSGTTIAMNTPSGWTLIQKYDVINGASRAWMWIFGKKVADGTETNVSVSWTGGNMYSGWNVMELTGIDSSAGEWPVSADGLLTSIASTFDDVVGGADTNLYGGISLIFLGGRGLATGYSSVSLGGHVPTGGNTGGVANCVCLVTVWGEGYAYPGGGGVTFTDGQSNPANIIMALTLQGAPPAEDGYSPVYTEQADYSREVSSGTAIGTTEVQLPGLGPDGHLTVDTATVGRPNPDDTDYLHTEITCGGRVKITTAGAGSIQLLVYKIYPDLSTALVGINEVSGNFLAGAGSYHVTIPDRTFSHGSSGGRFTLRAKIVRDSGSSLAATTVEDNDISGTYPGGSCYIKAETTRFNASQSS